MKKLLVALFFVFFCSNAVFADCFLDLKSLSTEADVVFKGKILELDQSDGLKQIVKFEVEKSWKGVTEKNLTVINDHIHPSYGTNATGYSTWNDYEFMVFAKYNDDGVLTALFCSEIQLFREDYEAEITKKITDILGEPEIVP